MRHLPHLRSWFPSWDSLISQNWAYRLWPAQADVDPTTQSWITFRQFSLPYLSNLINYQLSIINYQWLMINDQLSTLDDSACLSGYTIWESIQWTGSQDSDHQCIPLKISVDTSSFWSQPIGNRTSWSKPRWQKTKGKVWNKREMILIS
jgi:hypothetical protein